MSQSKVNHIINGDSDLYTLKRKRQSEGYLEPPVNYSNTTCFTNSAFCSTPKKVVARRRTPVTIKNNCKQNVYMEVKSIVDIINTSIEKNQVPDAAAGKQSQNPFEVVRKPPKKKKREIIEACFENPALNLELPEKQFNPYEVLRELPTKQATATQSNCFVNAALNLRTQDASTTINPFEITRSNNAQPTTARVGVKNAVLEDGSTVTTDLKIALPFKPTLGCRIDFSNLPREQLTPSKLLADKLVFSPVLVLQKRSIDSVSEESSMDIGKELDRYQLELENSINEAKMRKNIGTCMETQPTELTLQLDVEQKVTFTQRLEEIIEEDEEKENDSLNEAEVKTTTTQKCTISSGQLKLSKQSHTITATSEHNSYEGLKNEDVAYASESDDDEIDFKEPAPFVRAFQRDIPSRVTDSKESLHSTGSSDAIKEHKKSLNVGSILRKSLRKLMHPTKHEDIAKNGVNVKEKQKVENKEKQQHNNAYQIIRNSLRRKTTPKITPTTAEQVPVLKAEISIIDNSERTMKLKAELLPKNEGERKHTLRNSLRRTTREMGQHLMKTVFHKNQEAYELAK